MGFTRPSRKAHRCPTRSLRSPLSRSSPSPVAARRPPSSPTTPTALRRRPPRRRLPPRRQHRSRPRQREARAPCRFLLLPAAPTGANRTPKARRTARPAQSPTIVRAECAKARDVRPARSASLPTATARAISSRSAAATARRSRRVARARGGPTRSAAPALRSGESSSTKRAGSTQSARCSLPSSASATIAAVAEVTFARKP